MTDLMERSEVVKVLVHSAELCAKKAREHSEDPIDDTTFSEMRTSAKVMGAQALVIALKRSLTPWEADLVGAYVDYYIWGDS